MAAEQDPEGRAAARPLLTDLYQATMALGYWRAGRMREPAEFELFFRRCPFGGSFALAAGLRDCVRFLRAFRLRDAGTAARGGTLTEQRPLEPALDAPRARLPRSREPPSAKELSQPRRAPFCCALAPALAILCRPQTCSSWPRCCPRTPTPRSSSTSGPLTAPG